MEGCESRDVGVCTVVVYAVILILSFAMCLLLKMKWMRKTLPRTTRWSPRNIHTYIRSTLAMINVECDSLRVVLLFRNLQSCVQVCVPTSLVSVSTEQR